MRINCLNHIQQASTRLKQTFFHQQHSTFQKTQTSREEEKISTTYHIVYSLLLPFYNYYNFHLSNKDQDSKYHVCYL